MTTYTFTVDTADDGTFATDLSADVTEARWRLGLAAPFAGVAAPGQAEIALRNPDGRYTPPGDITRGHTLRITSDDGTTTRTHFVGVVTTLTPAPGQDGPGGLQLTATCALTALIDNRVRLAPMLDVRADEVVAAVLRTVPFRLRYIGGAFLVGLAGRAELGVHTRLPEAASRVMWSLEPGRTVFPYIGDTWDDGVPAIDAVREVVEAERGRFFVRRDGDFTLLSRGAELLIDVPVAAFTDNMDGLTVVYGADVVNRVAVSLTPRQVGGPDDVLWTLGGTQFIPYTGSITFVARFRGADGERLGALRVNQPRPVVDFRANTDPSGRGADISASVDVDVMAADATSARLRVTNDSGQSGYLLPGAVLRGRSLRIGNPLTVEARDGVSGTFYGARGLTLNLPGIASVVDGERVARYEMARRAAPRLRITELHLTRRVHRPQVLARTLFDRITVTEAGTGHNADYLIVAEAHHVADGGASHAVRWTLEPTNPGAFWRLGAGQLGLDTRLSY